MDFGAKFFKMSYDIYSSIKIRGSFKNGAYGYTHRLLNTKYINVKTSDITRSAEENPEFKID